MFDPPRPPFCSTCNEILTFLLPRTTPWSSHFRFLEHPLSRPPRTPFCSTCNEISTFSPSGAPPGAPTLDPPRPPFCSTCNELLTFLLSRTPPWSSHFLFLEHAPSPRPERLFALRATKYQHFCSLEHPLELPRTILPDHLFALHALKYKHFCSPEHPPGVHMLAFWSIPRAPSQTTFSLYV